MRDLRALHELPGEIGEAAFEQVVAEGGIQRRAGTYRGADDLPLEFLVRGGCLFVFALGELSAGRFRLTLQGAWRAL